MNEYIHGKTYLRATRSIYQSPVLSPEVFIQRRDSLDQRRVIPPQGGQRSVLTAPSSRGCVQKPSHTRPDLPKQQLGDDFADGAAEPKERRACRHSRPTESCRADLRQITPGGTRLWDHLPPTVEVEANVDGRVRFHCWRRRVHALARASCCAWDVRPAGAAIPRDRKPYVSE